MTKSANWPKIPSLWPEIFRNKYVSQVNLMLLALCFRKRSKKISFFTLFYIYIIEN